MDEADRSPRPPLNLMGEGVLFYLAAIAGSSLPLCGHHWTRLALALNLNALSAIRVQGHGASTPFGTVLDIIAHFDAKRHFAEIWRHSVGYPIQQGVKVLSLCRHSRIATQANSLLIDDQSGLCHAQNSEKMSSEQFL